MTEIVRKLEVLLFITREPLKKKKIQSLLGVDPKTAHNAIEILRKEYRQDGKGITVKEFGDEVQLSTNDLYADLVIEALALSDDKGLGNATLEVLSIIAYQQPITKVQIDHLRGVNSDYSIRLLVEKDLIESVSHLDTIGSPKLYTTTGKFLRTFNLETLNDLPEVEALR
ncbi:MAG: SMC-Scp complex subunit ScpB [Tissierellia bacterium]|jgi:segregation and condensation protein B|nr:SMC-Scp complex subunit ScpB [Tissierellia bacterium]